MLISREKTLNPAARATWFTSTLPQDTSQEIEVMERIPNAGKISEFFGSAH